jgi:hypothetical protein
MERHLLGLLFGYCKQDVGRRNLCLVFRPAITIGQTIEIRPQSVSVNSQEFSLLLNANRMSTLQFGEFAVNRRRQVWLLQISNAELLDTTVTMNTRV